MDNMQYLLMSVEGELVIEKDYRDNFDSARSIKADCLDDRIIKASTSISSFTCRICLWEFENESEIDIHNYLEHMKISHWH